MIQYIFLTLTLASSIFTAYMQSWIGLIMFIWAGTASIIIWDKAKEDLKPTHTNDQTAELKKLELHHDARLLKLEDTLSKLNLSQAFKPKQ